MAPTDQNKAFKHEEKEQISNIDDLDSASSSRAELKRAESINYAAVFRVAKCVGTATQENDDLNACKTSRIDEKIHPEKTEDGLEDGYLNDLYFPDKDIPCLCGVDITSKNSHIESTCDSTSLVRSISTKRLLKTWKSSGKGKKRKKAKSANKKKYNKKQKTTLYPGKRSVDEDPWYDDEQKCDVSMSSAIDSVTNFSLENKTCTDTVIPFVFDGAELMAKKPHEIACKRAAGDRKHKTSAKSGCIATQQAPGPKANGKICSHVRAHRGGGAGDGDDDDDGGGKPPWKPPEEVLCGKTGKQKRKKKKTTSKNIALHTEDSGGSENKADGTFSLAAPSSKPPEQDLAKANSSSSGMVVSYKEAKDQEMVADQQQQNVAHVQPEQSRRQEVLPSPQLLVKLHSAINHYNYCVTRPCVRCHRVETMLIEHYFEEMNGTCSCSKCQLWLSVLKYHTGICKILDCKVCKRFKKISQNPAPAPAAVQQNLLNVPTCGPSLDEDDLIVWKDERFQGITHFEEDKHYMFEKDSFLCKGGHGHVHNVEISLPVKEKYFRSDCGDFVVKKAEKVEEDERYVFEQTSQHPNFVQTFLVVKKTHPDPHHRIFMEKCEKSLQDYLNELVKKNKTLEIYEAMFYWTQTLDALKHLHHLRIPVIHKDIKAGNILLSIKDNLVRVKVADFDTVKKLHHAFTQPGLCPKGTPGLISPEVLRQRSHGRPSDIWNMAMFLLQMLFVIDFTKLQLDILALKNLKNINRFMFIHYTEIKIQEFLSNAIPQLKRIDNDLAELIQLCLDDDPLKRPTAINILQHPAVVKYVNMKINMDELIGKICPNLKT